jgi:hypothetical protein
MATSFLAGVTTIKSECGGARRNFRPPGGTMVPVASAVFACHRFVAVLRGLWMGDGWVGGWVDGWVDGWMYHRHQSPRLLLPQVRDGLCVSWVAVVRGSGEEGGGRTGQLAAVHKQRPVVRLGTGMRLGFWPERVLVEIISEPRSTHHDRTRSAAETRGSVDPPTAGTHNKSTRATLQAPVRGFNSGPWRT